MRTAVLFLAGVAAVAITTGSAVAQAGRYLAPPPIVLSPNLTDPWVMQLQPGNVPIYAAPQARSPRTWSAPPEPEAKVVRKVDPRALPLAPEFLPQEVAYDGPAAPGSIVIDTVNRFLYLVEEGGTARRYGVGVGRPGFTWAGRAPHHPQG